MVHAQTAALGPQFLVTWQAAGSYVPPGYPDKALPNQISQISASVELISNGHLADLSGQTIYWYENDILIGGGQGTQHIVFPPIGTAPNSITLKVELPSYNGAFLIHETQIPLVQPKAVIEAQHPEGQFSNNPLLLQATPYFFNTSDPSSLAYAWSVNGASPSTAENPTILQANISPSTPSGSAFTISLTITNPADKMTANDSTELTYTKQL